MQIYQESQKDKKSFKDDFIVDETLGRDVKFTLDVLQSSRADITAKIVIKSSNGTELTNSSAKVTDLYMKTFDNLEVNITQFWIT